LKFVKIKHLLWKKWKNFQLNRVVKHYNNIKTLERDVGVPVKPRFFPSEQPTKEDGLGSSILPPEEERTSFLHDYIRNRHTTWDNFPDQGEEQENRFFWLLANPYFLEKNELLSERVGLYRSKRPRSKFSLMDDFYRHNRLYFKEEQRQHFKTQLKLRGKNLKRLGFNNTQKIQRKVFMKDENNLVYPENYDSLSLKMKKFIFRFLKRKSFNKMKNNEYKKIYNERGSYERFRRKVREEYLSRYFPDDDELILKNNYPLAYNRTSRRMIGGLFSSALAEDFLKVGEKVTFSNLNKNGNNLLRSVKRNLIVKFNTQRQNLPIFKARIKKGKIFTGPRSYKRVESFEEYFNVRDAEDKYKKHLRVAQNKRNAYKFEYVHQKYAPSYFMNFFKSSSRGFLNKKESRPVVFWGAPRTMRNHRWLKLSPAFFASFNYQDKIPDDLDLIKFKLKFLSNISKYIKDASYLYIIKKKLNKSSKTHFSRTYLTELLFGNSKFADSLDTEDLEAHKYIFNVLLRKYIQKFVLLKHKRLNRDVTSGRRLKDLLLYLRLKRMVRNSKLRNVVKDNDANFFYTLKGPFYEVKSRIRKRKQSSPIPRLLLKNNYYLRRFFRKRETAILRQFGMLSPERYLVRDYHFQYRKLHRIRLHFSRFLFWLIRQQKRREFLVETLKKQRQKNYLKEGWLMAYPNLLSGSLRKRKKRLMYKKNFVKPGIIPDTNDLFFSFLKSPIYGIYSYSNAHLYLKQKFFLRKLKNDYFMYLYNKQREDYLPSHGWIAHTNGMARSEYGKLVLDFLKKLAYRNFASQKERDIFEFDKNLRLNSAFNFKDRKNSHVLLDKSSRLYNRARKNKWRFINQFFMRKIGSGYNVKERDRVLLKKKLSRFIKYNKYNYILNNILESKSPKFKIKEFDGKFFFDWNFANYPFFADKKKRRKVFYRQKYPQFFNIRTTPFDITMQNNLFKNINNILVNSSKKQRNIEVLPRFVSKTLREKIFKGHKKFRANYIFSKISLPHMYSIMEPYKSDFKIYGTSRRNLSKPQTLGLPSFLKYLWLKEFAEALDVKAQPLRGHFVYQNYDSFFEKLTHRRGNFISPREYIYPYKYLNPMYIEQYFKNFERLKGYQKQEGSFTKKNDSVNRNWRPLKSLFKLNTKYSFLLWVKRRYINIFKREISKNNFTWKNSIFNYLPFELKRFTAPLKEIEYVTIKPEALYKNGKIKIPLERQRSDFFLKRQEILKKLKGAIFASKAAAGFLFYHYRIQEWNDRLNYHVDGTDPKALDFELEQCIVERTTELLIPSFWVYRLPYSEIISKTGWEFFNTQNIPIVNDTVDLVLKLYPLSSNFFARDSFRKSFFDSFMVDSTTLNSEINGFSSKNSYYPLPTRSSYSPDEVLLAEQINMVANEKILKYVNQYNGLIEGRKREKFFKLQEFFNDYNLKNLRSDLWKFLDKVEEFNRIKPFFSCVDESVMLRHDYLRKFEHHALMERFYNMLNLDLPFNFYNKLNLSDELNRWFFYQNSSVLDNYASGWLSGFNRSLYVHFEYDVTKFVYMKNFFLWFDSYIYYIMEFIGAVPVDYLKNMFTYDWWYSSDFFPFITYMLLGFGPLLLYVLVLIFYRTWYIFNTHFVLRKLFERGNYLTSILPEYKVKFKVRSIKKKTRFWLLMKRMLYDPRTTLYKFYPLKKLYRLYRIKGKLRKKVVYRIYRFKIRRLKAAGKRKKMFSYWLRRRSWIPFSIRRRVYRMYKKAPFRKGSRIRFKKNLYMNSMFNSNSLDFLSYKLIERKKKNNFVYPRIGRYLKKIRKLKFFRSSYRKKYIRRIKPLYFEFNNRDVKQFKNIFGFSDTLERGYDQYRHNYDEMYDGDNEYIEGIRDELKFQRRMLSNKHGVEYLSDRLTVDSSSDDYRAFPWGYKIDLLIVFQGTIFFIKVLSVIFVSFIFFIFVFKYAYLFDYISYFFRYK
jgi:hypothetical protein